MSCSDLAEPPLPRGLELPTSHPSVCDARNSFLEAQNNGAVIFIYFSGWFMGNQTLDPHSFPS